MADIKSLQTLVSELQIFLRALNRQMEVSQNSLIYDLILRPYSVGGKLVMDQVETVKNLHILSTLTGTDLDNEATNYGLERSSGEKATVTLTFYTSVLPAGDVVISYNQQATTSGTPLIAPVSFTVDATATFPVASLVSYYSHDRMRYEFPVTATCDTVGTDGNVSAGYIGVFVSNPGTTYVSGVTNLTAAVGGEGLESDDDVRERIRMAMLGRDLNVPDGLRGYLLGLGFADATSIRAEDADAERATGVDAYVVDYTAQSFTEAYTYQLSIPKYFFTMRPVRAVTSVSVNGAPLSASAYNVYIDSSTPYRRSVYAYDFFDFVGTYTPGDSISVTYTYSSAIFQSQQTLLLPTNRILTADVLLKRAFPLSLYFTATLTLKANADGPSTRTKVKNALAQYMSENYRLGDPVQESDITIVLQEGYGDYAVDSVDAVYIEPISFVCIDEEVTPPVTYPAVNGIITLTKTQIAVYGAATIY
jgi:phage-related baseplate assembly protein